jgi:hypothetical protein
VMIGLPVSHVAVALRTPTGVEDLMLLEAPAYDMPFVLALVDRLAQPLDGGTIDWSALPLTDLDTLLFLIRQAICGDLIRAEARCPVPGCGARIDVAFHTSDYLAHHTPRVPANVVPEGMEAWYRLRDTALRFRVPTGADLIAVMGEPRPARALIQRCVDPPDVPARLLRRIERAMEALAPVLSRDVLGSCPECGRTIPLYFDHQRFCLHELQDSAALVYEEIHLLARQYGWSQAEILALPRHRRAAYAEMVRQERRSA